MDEVCESVASAVNGTVASCTLNDDGTVSVEVDGVDPDEVADIVDEDGFEDSLEDLPPGVDVSGSFLVFKNVKIF